ncbi:TetR family transcriptional regulator [Micromonospora halophytica]|uniref:Transcriptional regulator, TetR family n=1 Tax=Micromonospora halophytica TaxID=47864 RepID=A0A1C5J7M7_9ACTN|nr:TetR family transcriptional regulator [Micromonospora halophytica]SCG66567.1 transcriptional regulator, TetR family [Micromonospora halophytica]
MPRTGRRPGEAGTRAAILAAARDAFAARGYDGVSIRQVASVAAVDPALVHHYFGSKVELFRTAVRTAVDPEGLLSDLFAGDVDTLGERMVARFLEVWEGGAGANASALLRTAVTGGPTADLVREAVLPAVAGELLRRLGVDRREASLRAALIASQLSGLATTRYVLALPPMAGASAEWVVAVVGPTIQRYVTGELPRPLPADGGATTP